MSAVPMIRPGVIVSTYNRPDALLASLEGLAAQSYTDFQIIVADDGSTGETRRTVESFSEGATVPVHHVWHADEGFRLAAIRNRAAAAANANYLIFLDGDCVTPRHFVRSHVRLAEARHFVRGTRVRLDGTLTEEVLTDRLAIHEWSHLKWLVERTKGRISRFLPLLPVPLGPLRRLRPRTWQRVTGCNLAVWQEDLIASNGFDETFDGWGYEDFDLVVRLIRLGVKRKEGRFAVPVLHLWHPEEARNDQNSSRFEETLSSAETRAAKGIDQYL